jgi:hypothetical protein
MNCVQMSLGFHIQVMKKYMKIVNAIFIFNLGLGFNLNFFTHLLDRLLPHTLM